MIEIRKDFVVYAHYTIDTNELFYIGEGTLERSKRKNHRNRWWKFKVNKHNGFKIEIWFTNLTKELSEHYETELIIWHKNNGFNLTNICDGPMFKNHWLIGAPKEMHPMYGKKNPNASKRMSQWNKEHSGINHPKYGKPSPSTIERNKTGTFKRFKKSIRCNETGQIFESVKDAYAYLNKKPNCTEISKHLSGSRSHAFGFTWSYVTSY